MAKKRTLDLAPIWRDRGLKAEVKLNLMRALVWSVLIHGAEGWTLNKKAETYIESAEMWIYRRMLRISWTERRTNNYVLEQLGVQRSLLATINKRKLSYFGHTCRPSGCDLVRNTMLGIYPAKRKRGRPRIQYTDNIKDWLDTTLAGAAQGAQNRQEWRRKINQAVMNEEGQLR